MDGCVLQRKKGIELQSVSGIVTAKLYELSSTQKLDTPSTIETFPTKADYRAYYRNFSYQKRIETSVFAIGGLLRISGTTLEGLYSDFLARLFE